MNSIAALGDRELLDLQLLPMKVVCVLVGRSASSVYDMVRAGTFPQPLRDGPKCARWQAGQVRAWLLEKAATANDDQGALNVARAKRASEVGRTPAAIAKGLATKRARSAARSAAHGGAQ